MNPNYFTPISASKFICEKCDFKCCKKVILKDIC